MPKPNRITLDGDQKSIHIHDMTIEDPRAHHLLSQEPGDRIEQKLRDAITIGTLALDRTAATAETDWVTDRLEAQVAAVNQALERQAQATMAEVRSQFDPTRAGLLTPIAELIA